MCVSYRTLFIQACYHAQILGPLPPILVLLSLMTTGYFHTETWGFLLIEGSLEG